LLCSADIGLSDTPSCGRRCVLAVNASVAGSTVAPAGGETALAWPYSAFLRGVEREGGSEGIGCPRLHRHHVVGSQRCVSDFAGAVVAMVVYSNAF